MQQENPENPPLRRLPFSAGRTLLLIAALILAALAIFFAPRFSGQAKRAPAPIARAQDTLPQATLLITRKDGKKLPFTVEIASTEQQQETGLMYRTHLNENEGMLFPAEKAYPRTMWMKNTLIPLDLLFIDAKGRIVTIIERAEPESETFLESGVPVQQVLELRGGMVQAYGIKIGDHATRSEAEPGTLPAEIQP